MSEIYLAGGCFWGLEQYLGFIDGVTETFVGYANGETADPTYEDVCYKNTGHSETVKVVYDETAVKLSFILYLFFQVIDPTSLNRQGGDTGVQYRTGIYYTNEDDISTINKTLEFIQKEYERKVVVEVLPLKNFFLAEEYHQKYLQKNPDGYCHITSFDFKKARHAKVNPCDYTKKSSNELSDKLTQIQRKVALENGTEPPFENEYWDIYEKGIYVDITTGEPLFASTDKFDAGCGWPSFSKPIDLSVLIEKRDFSHGLIRTEIRSRVGDIHLGHVFDATQGQPSGLRYCINSASLRFVKLEDMKKEGYENLIYLVK